MHDLTGAVEGGGIVCHAWRHEAHRHWRHDSRTPIGLIASAPRRNEMTTSTAEATPTQTAVLFPASDAAAVTGQTIDADGGWATTAPSIFSRPVATNLTVGTVAYAAPEQLMGLEIDERAEQCAPAAKAFHLIRFAAESAFEPGCSLPRRNCARFDTDQV